MLTGLGAGIGIDSGYQNGVSSVDHVAHCAFVGQRSLDDGDACWCGRETIAGEYDSHLVPTLLRHLDQQASSSASSTNDNYPHEIASYQAVRMKVARRENGVGAIMVVESIVCAFMKEKRA
ncbi:MAG: hypothetical protein R2826_06325 [Thermoleophilia bacterium]